MQQAPFKLKSRFQPTGDQPQAIEKLVDGLAEGHKYQTLLGVTGSGKTYTMANIIEKTQKPTLIISHNKTLAFQLFEEFRQFFPNNAVHYFISTYDYYQPEAYLPIVDQYIEKRSSINEEILWQRMAAIRSLLEREDTIVISSSSCLFSLGSPDHFKSKCLQISTGDILPREHLLRQLVKLQYDRVDNELVPGTFKVRGDIIQVYPIDAEHPYRIELFGNEIDRIFTIKAEDNEVLDTLTSVNIYPTQNFMFSDKMLEEGISRIQAELDERVHWFKQQNKLTEAERLYERVTYDLTLLKETGYCSGVENYVSHLFRLKEDESLGSLFQYFPDDYLLFIDESHVTLPQLQAMAPSGVSTKKNLIDYGFRLPSSIANGPLSFEKVQDEIHQAIFVSATPSSYELEVSEQITEQIIRPTGVIDPPIEVYRFEDNIPHLISKIKEHIELGNRVLIGAITKVMAEEMTEYLLDLGIRANYLHGDLEVMDRTRVLQQFRKGEFDVLVGINLLREGLDLPEVSFVAILEADKRGFLRSATSLIQTVGRAARNVDSEVVLYAKELTDAITETLEETERRRAIQLRYNEEHQITPVTALKNNLSFLEI